MKAMILAAGLGTRLRPLTDTRPKALVELSGRTLLEITLSRLRAFGVREVIINVHHFADMILDYLKANDNFGMRIEISREDVLLDTGGGLKKAAWFFLEASKPGDSSSAGSSPADEPFLLHNVDVISNIDLRRMVQFHNEHHALATLAVQTRETSRYLLFNDHLQLSGRRIAGKDTLIPISHQAVIPSEAGNLSSSRPRDLSAMNLLPGEHRGHTGSLSREATPPPSSDAHPELARQGGRNEESEAHSPLTARHSPLLQPLAFSGIHLISPRLLPLITEAGIFSIIEVYLRLAAQGENILAFRADDYYWRDLGRPSDLAQASLDLQQKTLF